MPSRPSIGSDKSASMNLAIELGKRIGALISTISAQALYVYAFDTVAYPIESAGTDLAAWEKALHGITAGGSTSCGVPLEAMRRKRQYVEQIIIVTDEEENTPPLFVETLKKYRQEVKADPNVLTFRLARHHWGSGKANAWFIAEYESLDGLYRSEEFQSDWYDENFPEGTPEREAADKATEEDFLPFFSDHVDEITTTNMSRAK